MMAVTAERLFNIVSGRKISEGSSDKVVKSFNSLSKETKLWWEKKAQILQQLINEDNNK